MSETKQRHLPKWAKKLTIRITRSIRKEENDAKTLLEKEEQQLPHEIEIYAVLYGVPLVIFAVFPTQAIWLSKIVLNAFATMYQNLRTKPEGLFFMEYLAFAFVAAYFMKWSVPFYMMLRRRLFTPALTQEKYNRLYDLRQQVAQQEFEEQYPRMPTQPQDLNMPETNGESP